jgi:hypothetical protein
VRGVPCSNARQREERRSASLYYYEESEGEGALPSMWICVRQSMPHPAMLVCTFR